MVFVIGGAWQGKLDWAKETCSLTDGDIFSCGAGAEIDFSRRCIVHLEDFTLACVDAGVDPVAYFDERADRWADSVLICSDVSCGVVPMSARLRLWRNETGRFCQYLAKRADRVSRIFCGLEQRLK